MTTAGNSETLRSRWRTRIDVEVIVANGVSAAFWTWFAQDPLPLNSQFLPMLIAFGLGRPDRRPGRSRLLIWTLALATGGAFAALALKLHAMRP